MDHTISQSVNRYYEILGLSRDASSGAIRAAYKRLAMKWHPDKCSSRDRAEAKLRFQEIQEAYAVLSDEKRKVLYDCGLYNPDDDASDVEGLSSFMDEMTNMMGRVQTSQEIGVGSSLEDLQKLFLSMFGADLAVLGNPNQPSASSMGFDKKRNRRNSDFDASCFGSCFMGETISSSSSQACYLLNEGFYFGSNLSGGFKKTKCAANGQSSNFHDMGIRKDSSKAKSGFHASTCANAFHRNMHDTGYDGSAA